MVKMIKYQKRLLCGVIAHPSLPSYNANNLLFKDYNDRTHIPSKQSRHTS